MTEMEAPLPQSLGALQIEETGVQTISANSSSGSCVADINAAVALLHLTPSAEVLPFLSVVRLEVYIDGNLWQVTDYGGLARDGSMVSMPSRTGTKRRGDLFFAACVNDVETDPGLSLGNHRVEVAAVLAGTPQPFSIESANFHLDCGCEGAPDGRTCRDGEACTANDRCLAGVCEGVALAEGAACDDGNACSSDDRCAAGKCVATVRTSGGCDDGNLCTENDTCTAAGTCVGQMSCEDGDSCTWHFCMAAFGAGCREAIEQDGSACTLSDKPCFTGACESGACTITSQSVDGSPCDDLNPCTEQDSCLGGVCAGVAADPTCSGDKDGGTADAAQPDGAVDAGAADAAQPEARLDAQTADAAQKGETSGCGCRASGQGFGLLSASALLAAFFVLAMQKRSREQG